jgi:hypothetical protein
MDGNLFCCVAVRSFIDVSVHAAAIEDGANHHTLYSDVHSSAIRSKVYT